MKRTRRRRRKSDATAGKGKVRISTTIPIDTDEELCRLAEAAGLTRSGLAGQCIVEAVTRRSQADPAKVIEYPLTHPGNPTARAAEDAAS